MKQKIKGLFFDAGGVLLTMDFNVLSEHLHHFAGETSHYKKYQHFFPESSDFEIAEQISRPLLDDFLQDESSEKASTRLQFMIYIWEEAWKSKRSKIAKGTKLVAENKVNAFETPLPTSELFKQWAKANEKYHNNNNLWQRIIPGTKKALAAIQSLGITMAVVSNADGRVADILDKAGLAKYFALIIDSHIVGVEKPDPEIFNIALKKLELKSEETLYLGDFYSIDVVGSRKAGLTPVLMDPLKIWKKSDVLRIQSLSEYPELIAKLIRE